MERRETRQSAELFPDPQQTAAWFAGVLEVGATSGIGVAQYTNKGGHLRIQTLPYLEIHSTYPPMLDKLQMIYGGMKKPKFWCKSGKVAAEIISETYDFTVARQDHALAMINWLNAETAEEEIKIAHDIENRGWQQRGTQEAYQSLISNPAFVAGVLDSRASLYSTPASHHQTLKVQVSSKNVALLSELKSNFGGYVRITEPAGTVIKHGDISFETQADSWAWDLQGSQAINLIAFTHDFMQTPAPENWAYKRLEERQVEEMILAERIKDHVRSELEKVKTGEIPRITNDPALAKIFSIDKKRVSRYLRQTLTASELTTRYAAIRSFARRSVDASLAHQIVDYIKDEVARFQSGQVERISYLEELGDEFGIGDRAVARHVVPLLDTELKQARADILRSQISRERNLAYWQKQRKENPQSN